MAHTSADRIVNLELLDTLEAIDGADSAAEVLRLLAGFSSTFGFTTVALGQLANPATRKSSSFNIGNWPSEWRAEWIQKNYILHDPIARMALKTRRSFTWRQAYEHASRFGRTILDASRDHGFKDGLAIPIHSEEGPPGCVTLGGDFVDLSARERGAMELVATHAYVRLEVLHGTPIAYQTVKNLSRREIDVLHYVAAGKTNWEIGRILSLSEHSVCEYLKGAQRKLNCVNRTHAVAVAMQHSLILP